MPSTKDIFITAKVDVYVCLGVVDRIKIVIVVPLSLCPPFAIDIAIPFLPIPSLLSPSLLFFRSQSSARRSPPPFHAAFSHFYGS